MGVDPDAWAGFAVGIAAAIVMSAGSGLGVALQRKGHVDEERKSPELQRGFWRNPVWLAGITIFIGSQVVGSAVAMGQLPTIVLAPIGGVQLAFNGLFAALLVGDAFDLWDIAATVAVGFGAAIVAICGYTNDGDLSIEQQVALLHRPPFVRLFVVQQLISVAILAVFFWMGASGNEENSSRTRSRRGIVLAILAGMLQAESFILGKCVIELFKITFFGSSNQFGSFESLGLMAALIFFGITNMLAFSESMRLASVIIVSPIAFCGFVVVSFLDSLIFFNSGLPASDVVMVLVGASVIMVGVLILSRTKRDNPVLGGGTPEEQKPLLA